MSLNNNWAIVSFEKWINFLNEEDWRYTYRYKIDDDDELKFIPPTSKEIDVAKSIYREIYLQPNCRYIYTIDNEFCFIKTVENTGSHHLTVVRGGGALSYLFLPRRTGKSVNIFANIIGDDYISTDKVQSIFEAFNKN